MPKGIPINFSQRLKDGSTLSEKIIELYTGGEGGSPYISKKLQTDFDIKIDESAIRRFLQDNKIPKPKSFKTQAPDLSLPKERYNIIRPINPRDFSQYGAPNWAKFKISFRKEDLQIDNPDEFKGTKYYKSEKAAKDAIAKKARLIAEAKEAKLKPPTPPKADKFLVKVDDPTKTNNVIKQKFKEVIGSKGHPETYKPTGVTKNLYRALITVDNKTVLSTEFGNEADAIKAVKDYRIKNPIKNPPPDLKTLDAQKKKRYLDKQAKSEAVKKRGGYYGGPHKGTLKAHLGHTGNVFGIELITGDRLAYTPAEINQAMSAEGKGLDSKIRKVSEKIEKLKKQNLPPARKKKLLEQADALLVRLASQSQGFKKVTLSDGSTFGGDRLTIDMLDEFPGKTEREINEFVKNWKDEKIITEEMVRKNPSLKVTPPDEVENIKKANFFEMNRKAALKAAEKIGKTEQTRIISHLNFFDDARADALEGGQICRLVRATGATGGTISCVDAVEEAIQKEPEKLAQKASRLEKFKNSATGFLNFAKKGGKFGALAAVGAAGAGVVKTFMNDDPTTYLSDENQQKNMLIEMVTGPMVDKPDSTPEILDWQLPALGATAAAGTVATAPSTIEAARSARFGKKPSGYTKTALKTLGRGLATTGTPLGLAAFEPLHIAGQVQAGDSLGEIATNPWNYAGLAFADDLSKFATKGLGPTAAKIMRLGISPAALKVGSRFLGIPGLALSLGISGYETYDDWKKKRGWFSEE
tara:strand:- start:25 stop:2286 length:2262 start_codon:yes stop_codon:yes gene_type:complete